MKTLDTFKATAATLDAGDPLGSFRERFAWPDPNLVYLDGNSLGCLPRATLEHMDQLVRKEWAGDLIRSWNKGWFDLPLELGDLLAPLIGAQPGEVCFADSVSVNLFKLASAALKRDPQRKQVLTDDLNFPSDYYVLQGMGDRVELVKVKSPDGISLSAERLGEAIDGRTALVTLSHVVFKSGYLYDLKAVTRTAHEAGALVLADLSHSVGSVPVDLEGWGVDLAVGCAYKYLNGGPGAPAFLYVRKELQEELQPVLTGWFGAKDPFSFNPDYVPVKGIRRFLVGTPPILSMAAIEPGIRLLREAGMERVRAKSLNQAALLVELFDTFLEPLGFRLGSPREPEQRGSHISLQHPEAFRINQAMMNPAEGKPVIIPDFRRPDNLRLGIAPLYIRYTDIVCAVERIREIVLNREYEQFDEATQTVT